MAMPKLDGTVLITGASGFIGGRLRDGLLAAGCDVVAIRRPGSPPAKAGRSVQADYGNVSELERVIAEEKPHYLLHVAGVTKGTSYEDFRLGNVVPTRNLLTALRQAHPDIKRFVLVSSLTAYGPSATSAPHREEDPRSPIEYYGRSKLEAEQVVEEESGDVPWTILRPPAVYGPGDVDHFTLFQSAVLGWNLFYGNRDKCGSWIYVDDCVRGIVEAARDERSVGKGYFLTSDVQLTWGQFQSEIVSAVGRPVRDLNLPEQLMWVSAFAGEMATRVDKKPRLFNLQKAKMGAQQAWTCVGDAARRDFGFTAETDLAEGVRLTHEWYEANGWYKSPSLRSLARRLGRSR
jgi:nucleoside-diphosphate-sugar epimerase